jgi:pyoverdine/dityrosine biosynthesis protein Dit1
MIKIIFDSDQIEFLSLPQIFSLNSDKLSLQSLCENEIPHYIPTLIEEEAELCRKILMASCHTGDEELRKLIDQKDPIKLKLYRGFIKFMEEDLANNSSMKPLSKSARKKICGKIAFEMIKVSIMIIR